MTQLQKIVAKAKTLKKSHPNTKWTDLIKKASKLVTPAKKSVGAVKKTVAKKYTKKQLEKIAENYAYATGEYPDRATWRLLDPDYTSILLPKYLKSIDDYEKKYNTKLGKISNTKKAVGYKEDRIWQLKKATPYIRKYKAKGYSRKDAIKQANIDSNYMSGTKKYQARSTHKDTKSHNVNIRVMSGTKRNTGYVGALIIKKYTLTELKKLNPIYFEKGADKLHGVYKRKLMISNLLQSQVMIEAYRVHFPSGLQRFYGVRLITSYGRIETPKYFDTLLGASNYIGKNIIL